MLLAKVIRYWDNGNLKIKYQVSNQNRLEGLWESYNSNGTIETKGYYINNSPVRLWLLDGKRRFIYYL